MFLKSLTLKGFKSFAETTTLEFEPGITVVVGPNGSGKSNVVDAVAWVLGAQGPRTVRSSKMEDVIFAGSAKRPALGRAEVALTIDNTAGLLPIGFSEVTLTRTLFRSSGESEYAINGVPCRLLDIQELLSDSGVGRQQHVIVSQGQLDAVLDARPEDRRLVIEEAAGVLKYRRRREKAQRRLDATESNLVRLQDLLREVRRQLRPLERQADAARRHDSLAAELHALRIHLGGREVAGLQGRLGAADAARASAANTERELRATLARLDADVLVAEQESGSLTSQDLADAVGRLDALRERARGLAAVLAERRRSITRQREAEADSSVVASLAAEADQLAAELITADQDAAGLTQDRTGTEPDLEERLRSVARQLETVDAALDDARRRHETASDAQRAAEQERRTWMARADALDQALDESRARAGAERLAGVAGVVGTLLDLVEIDDGWEAAFEAALGEAIAAVVVDGVGSAREALRQLHERGEPGAVLPLDVASAPASLSLDATAIGEPVRAHVHSVASRPSVDSLLDSLLATAVLVDGGWPEALDVALAHPGIVAVTREGDRFSTAGWRAGAGMAAATGRALNDARDAAAAAGLAVASAAAAADQAKAEVDTLENERVVVGGHRAAAEQELLAQRTTFERRAAGIEERRALLAHRRAEVVARLERLGGEAVAVSPKPELQAAIVTRLSGLVDARIATLDEAIARVRTHREIEADRVRNASSALEGLRRERQTAERQLGEVREKAQRAEVDEAEARVRLEAAVESLRREHDVEPETAVVAECPELPPGTSAPNRARELERELRLMGPVNPLALEEFTALNERHQFLEAQLEDVKTSRRELAKVIKAIDAEIVELFSAAYTDVADNFTKLFSTLFPGGTGRLRLTDPDDMLNTGIEVEARPSGKNVRKLSLLSGGERSLTALAFLFAVFRSRPSPFYLLDEVEAALDDVNLHRFLDLIHEFREEAQLLVVSHQKRTMEAADCLYGVTMQPGGSSRVVSERIEARA
ncbi:MAG TPA: AAA family ATPase [Acidimicrobiales bacterium]|nr:AAA family ATPase [Acidimicrobiales bacterium]